MATRHVVAKAADIPPGERKLVSVKGRDIGVFNVNGEFFALLNKCPHSGAALCTGRIIGLAQSDQPGQYRLLRKGEMLRCPWHGWEFDIRTGQSWCDPNSTFVRSFEVRIEPGEQLAKGPYVAETFPVSVEDDYLVIEL
jgi:3-phenylpropionate/trans-cinnamate dioxygenase ferredoxin subunit